MSNIPVFSVSLPEYKVGTEPNHKNIGKIVDDVFKEHFQGQTIVVRGISSSQHSIPITKLIDTIQELGTDHYDPDRVGDRYENIQGKHIDFFCFSS